MSTPGFKRSQQKDHVPGPVFPLSKKEQAKEMQATSGEGNMYLQKKLTPYQSGHHSNWDEVAKMAGEVLSTPGETLDSSSRDFFQQSMGHDFSKVRIYTGGKASDSARAINARAYTAGHKIVFNSDYFMPHTLEGDKLLAHELTHVIQQESQEKPVSQITAGHQEYKAEREADLVAEHVISGEPVPSVDHRTNGLTIQGSWLGGLLGGIVGAGAGALIGLAIGGPLGAIVGGLIGLVGGAMIGEKATEKRRSLTSTEKNYAKEIFKDTIDYDKIDITRDSLYAVGAPRTIGNTIHLKSGWSHFEGDTMNLTEAGRLVLIHEMGHVWQYQNGGLAYIPGSLLPQMKAWITGKGRDAAYNWRAAHKEGKPWNKWNAEQQAAAIEDYNILLRRNKASDPTLTLEDISELALLTSYMKNVWERLGAPGSKTRG